MNQMKTENAIFLDFINHINSQTIFLEAKPTPMMQNMSLQAARYASIVSCVHVCVEVKQAPGEWAKVMLTKLLNLWLSTFAYLVIDRYNFHLYHL